MNLHAALVLIALSSLSCSSSAFANPSPSPTPADTFQQRRQLCIDSVLNSVNTSAGKLSAHNAFWRAELMFDLGKVDGGRRLVGRGLDQLVPGNRENRWIYGGNSGFTVWPGLDCYIRYNQFFDPALKERYRKIYTGGVFYKRLTTSNHKLMAAVGRYLATQVWGDKSFSPDPFFLAGKSVTPGQRWPGTYFTDDDPTGEKYCRQRIAAVQRVGPEEYASRPYGSQDILPFLTLAECSSDPGMRKDALKAYEACLAGLAPAYLRGHLATFSTRSYPDIMSQTPWGIASVLWAYFGGVPPANPSGEWGLRAMTSTYRPPPIIVTAGADRSAPDVFRSRMSGWALYHFINKTYALFSRSPKADHPKTLGQNYPCGVMWDTPDPTQCSFLWVTNPVADDNNPGSTARPNGIHTHGVTPNEQQLQFRDAMLSVYNIPEIFRNPYVLGFIPGEWQAMINDSAKTGHIYLDYGSVLIAITASTLFKWDPASGVRAPAAKLPPGCSEFRIMSPRCAVALETASPFDYPGATPTATLSAFRDALKSNGSITVSTNSTSISATYISRDHHTLHCTFNGPDSIDATPVDYTHWPLLECPWYTKPAPAKHGA